MANKPIEYYIDRYQQGIITKEEVIVLHALLQQPENHNALEELMLMQWKQWEESDLELPDVTERVQQAVAARINRDSTAKPMHRVHFLKTAWFRYAAAVIILLGAGTFVWLNTRHENSPVGIVEKIPGINDIVPGRAAPVLTLADGTTIVLDSTASGNLARQGGARVIKLDDGSLEYVATGTSSKGNNEVLYNTISTPAGTQYQVTLSDGTNVWLNVASSITYPTVFAGNERNIKVTGEAYFEVAKNKERPFVADVDGKFSIRVLGTAFNVNAYANENNYRTTLLEGSIEITRDSKMPAGKVLLQPGEQAQVGKAGQVAVINNVDVEKVMAWKNGLFNFNNAHLEEVMREIARWYNIEVVYENDPPQVQFVGKISRDLSLSQVLNGLKGTGFNFRIAEGRKLIITP